MITVSMFDGSKYNISAPGESPTFLDLANALKISTGNCFGYQFYKAGNENELFGDIPIDADASGTDLTFFAIPNNSKSLAPHLESGKKVSTYINQMA